MPTPARTRSRRAWREQVAQRLARPYGGVITRAALRTAGLTAKDIEIEIRAGRWRAVGRHTVAVLASALPPWCGGAGEVATRFEGAPSNALWWWALWETGSQAVLDGASSLVACGLTGFDPDVLDLSIPPKARLRPLPGVRTTRRRCSGPVCERGIRRTAPAVATIRAAQLAVSDRQAALLVCLPVQQRIARPEEVLAHWATVRRSPRREFIDVVVADVCNGVHSLGELDFARHCRARGLPEPARQRLVRHANGRFFLDVEFPGGLVVEIDGVHHSGGLTPVDDALRANEVTLTARRVLRIPVLGLRTDPDAFFAQVARGLRSTRSDG